MPAFAALLVGLLLFWLAVNLVKAPADFTTIFFIGLTNGAVYALIALGYTLVYGILELINFAHGDVFMLGGMISSTFLLSVFHLGEGESVGSFLPAILVALAWKGAGYVALPNVLPRSAVFSIGGVVYTWNKLIVVLITIPVLIGLMYLIRSTKQGKAMRATAQDKDAAAMMGINVNRTISF